MSKLKPCPFCGGEVEIKHYINFVKCTNTVIVCKQCGMHCECREHLFEKWNNRHEPPTPGGAIVPAGNKRIKKPLKKCLQCNAVIEYNNIRLDDMGYSCCPHCQSNRLKTIYEVIHD